MAKTHDLSPLVNWPRNIGTFIRDDIFTSISNPGVSLYEDDNHLYVEAAVPGMDRKDINLSYSSGTLSIDGEHREEDVKERKYYRTMQRTFNYQVALPVEVKDEKPEANLKNGVLKVIFEKSLESKPHKIEIRE